jgi:hypothetical protein
VKRLRPSSLLAALALALAAPGAPAAGVIISEFMASNDRTLKDDFDEDADWIELVNTGSAPVNLLDWRLTDNASNPAKWVFPERILQPGEFLLVYATGRNRRLPGAPLHTNFSLASEGEFLALIRPDGSVATGFAPAYPPQVTDIAYGFPQSVTITVAPQAAACQVGVPVSSTDYTTNFANWTTQIAGFTGSSWQNARTGVGFDDPEAAYGAWIHPDGEISARLKNQQRTACLRVPFTLTDPADLLALRLRMRWDDGFIAYVNGIEVARNSAPAAPQWNSLGTLNRNEALNQQWTEWTINPAAVPLQSGTNILAIHGFNITVGSSDFLLLPELDAVYSAAAASATYFTSPTPGAPNGSGGPIGPVIRDATASLPRPTGNASSPPAVVTARVSKSVFNVSPATVRLAYRTQFGGETQVTLLDNGVAPDQKAGDGIHSGTLPTTGPAAGQMLRWRFQAADVNGNLGRAPAYLDPLDSDQYFGTVAANADEAASALPLLHLFVADVAAGDTRAGTRGAVFYLDRFYDNVMVDLHGQSTAGFQKKSYDLDFNGDNRFVWHPDAALKAKDVNLLSNHADKTRTRNTLAHETAARAGTPHHFAFPVRVQRNAAFHGVLDLVEDGDERMLERNGLAPDGALYKMYDNLSNVSNGEKKTRKDEDKSDLQALINGLNPATALATRRAWAYDNLDLPATVNYLATRQLISDKDHGHKNYYVFRDSTGTREWRPLIWDVDLTFGHDWNPGPAYFDDTIYHASPVRPMQTENNRLYRLVAETPEFREMFLRRFRSLMDGIFQPPGTSGGLLETRMRGIVASVDPDPADPSAWTDGDRDFAKWGTWGRGLRPREETEYVIANYFAPRRAFLFDTNPATRQRYGLTAGSGDPLPDTPQANNPGMVVIDSLDFNPAGGTQAHEFLVLRNTTAAAVDLSGWTLAGAIDHAFPAGTVIPSGPGTPAAEFRGLLHLARDAYAFRQRPDGPGGGQLRLVQGNYSGQLSARGETVVLRDDAGRWIADFTYAGAPTPAQLHLRISEIHYHPAAPAAAEPAALPGLTKEDFEFLELANFGTAALDLGGATFTAGITFTFPAATLAPGGRLILAKNPAAFALRYPGCAVPVFGPYDGQLDNGGERLELADGSGEIVLDFEYKDGWYPATDGGGHSLVLRDPATPHGDFGQPRNWAISAAPGGSPGNGDHGFAQAYRGWDNFHFSGSERDDPLVSGPHADPDGDGLPNWREYAFGTDPRAPDHPVIAFQWADDNGVLRPAVRFARPAGALDLAWELRSTPALGAAWQASAGPLHEVLPLAGDREQVVWPDVLAAPDTSARFLSLRVAFTE